MIFLPILKMVFGLIWFIVKTLFFVLFPFFVSFLAFFVYFKLKGYSVKKPSNVSTYLRRNFFIRLFYDFPRRLVLDIFNRNPDKFPVDGLYLFAGEQGSGKTIAAVEMALRLKKQFPKSKLESNISIDSQDGQVTGWQDIVFHTNGTFGMVIFIDELQNWFNSQESRDFPPDMIQEICQLRKQVKCIIGTSQVFSRVAKPIREQVKVLCKPITFAGCLTIVRMYRPQVNQDGTIDKLRRIKTYFFVHNAELRNSYDTYEKVLRLVNAGFKPKDSLYTTDKSSNLLFFGDKKSLSKKK